MTKARMQPTVQTGIVWKISIFLFLLLAVVLYKLNDYFKDEKWQLAQNQVRTQIVATKTALSSQIATLKNVLSSYENELNESKINWVQLDPFFGIANAEKVNVRGGPAYRVNRFIGRSGSVGANWSPAFLEKAVTRQKMNSSQPIAVQIFQDNTGAKYVSIRFLYGSGRALYVVGGAEYFQKYFDVSRGGRMTALLQTTENVIAAHSEADYMGTSIDDNAISAKDFLVEKEEIAGTNLVAIHYMNRQALVKGFSVPWSVVGLIIGFGLLIVGVLIYTMEPLERRIEKYKMQERDQIFKETVSESLKTKTVNTATEVVPVQSPPAAFPTATDIVKAKLENTARPAPLFNSPQFEAEEARPFVATSSPSMEDDRLAHPFSKLSDDDFKINEVMTPVKEDLPMAAAELEEPRYVPDPTRAKRSVGTIVLDTEQNQVIASDVLAPVGTEVDSFDLDKVLSLDDLDGEEKSKAPDPRAEFVKENLTSKKINVTEKAPRFEKPQFAMKRKDFKVDEFQVEVRRPERS